MSRHHFRAAIEGDIARVKEALSGIKEKDRLHVIAEALYDLRSDTLHHSCGCFDYDITIDYRPADVRYKK